MAAEPSGAVAAEEVWMTAEEIESAQLLSLPPKSGGRSVIGCIAGSCVAMPSWTPIGLLLKRNSAFARLAAGAWTYSFAARALLREFCSRWPEVLSAVGAGEQVDPAESHPDRNVNQYVHGVPPAVVAALAAWRAAVLPRALIISFRAASLAPRCAAGLARPLTCAENEEDDVAVLQGKTAWAAEAGEPAPFRLNARAPEFRPPSSIPPAGQPAAEGTAQEAAAEGTAGEEGGAEGARPGAKKRRRRRRRRKGVGGAAGDEAASSGSEEGAEAGGVGAAAPKGADGPQGAGGKAAGARRDDGEAPVRGVLRLPAEAMAALRGADPAAWPRSPAAPPHAPPSAPPLSGSPGPHWAPPRAGHRGGHRGARLGGRGRAAGGGRRGEEGAAAGGDAGDAGEKRGWLAAVLSRPPKEEAAPPPPASSASPATPAAEGRPGSRLLLLRRTPGTPAATPPSPHPTPRQRLRHRHPALQRRPLPRRPLPVLARRRLPPYLAAARAAARPAPLEPRAPPPPPPPPPGALQGPLRLFYGPPPVGGAAAAAEPVAGPRAPASGGPGTPPASSQRGGSRPEAASGAGPAAAPALLPQPGRPLVGAGSPEKPAWGPSRQHRAQWPALSAGAPRRAPAPAEAGGRRTSAWRQLPRALGADSDAAGSGVEGPAGRGPAGRGAAYEADAGAAPREAPARGPADDEAALAGRMAAMAAVARREQRAARERARAAAAAHARAPPDDPERRPALCPGASANRSRSPRCGLPSRPGAAAPPWPPRGGSARPAFGAQETEAVQGLPTGRVSRPRIRLRARPQPRGASRAPRPAPRLRALRRPRGGGAGRQQRAGAGAANSEGRLVRNPNAGASAQFIRRRGKERELPKSKRLSRLKRIINAERERRRLAVAAIPASPAPSAFSKAAGGAGAGGGEAGEAGREVPGGYYTDGDAGLPAGPSGDSSGEASGGGALAPRRLGPGAAAGETSASEAFDSGSEAEAPPAGPAPGPWGPLHAPFPAARLPRPPTPWARPAPAAPGQPPSGPPPPPAAAQLPRESPYREYCSQVVSGAVSRAAAALLAKLVEFQTRLRTHDPINYKRKKRYVCGLREVQRGVEAGRVRCCVVAPDIEPVAAPGGLDDILAAILAASRARAIPVVFALSRNRLGRALGKRMKMSVVGIYNPDGAHEQYREMLTLAEAAREEWAARAAVLPPDPAPS
eukprot:tig00021721_g23219.t1